MRQILRFLTRLGFSIQTFKTALAATLSWIISTTLTTSQYPYFAPLAAMLTVQVTVAHSLKIAVQRLVGVILGVIISIFIGHWLSIGASSIFFITLISMAVTSALHTSQLVTSQVAISSLMVLALSKGPGYATARVTETIIGSIIAILINAVLVPPNAVPAAEKRIRSLYSLAATTLNKLIALLYEKDLSEHSGFDDVLQLVEQTEKGIEAIKLAEQSLKYSPFPTKMRRKLAQLAVRTNRLEHIALQIRGIRKGLIDLPSTHVTTVDIQNLRNSIESTVICLFKAGHQINSSNSNVSLLIENIENARSLQTICLANLKQLQSLSTLREIAGILTDLNRILQEIEEEI